MPNYLSRMKPNGANGTEYKLKDEELREAFDVFKEDIKGTQTVTGNPITLTDASETYAQGLSVELEPKQDLHGYDFSWVGGAGKNKLPMTVERIKADNTFETWSGNSYTLNGVTFTILTDNANNVTGIKVNGTASAKSVFNISKVLYLPNDTYRISGCPSGGSPSTYRIADTYTGYFADYGSGTSFTSTNARIDCVIEIGSGYTADNLIFYPMIRLSTETDPTFAPYSNICPITGYIECEVDDVGKNKFDEANYYDLYTNYDYVANTYRCKRIQLKPNTTYIITQRATVTSTVILLLNSDYYVNGTGFFDCRKAGDSKTYTTGEDGYLYIGTLGNDADTNARLKECKIQIEKGTTATPYEPFKSRTASVTFGQTVYGGRSDFTEGGTDGEYDCENMWGLTWTKFKATANVFSTNSRSNIKKVGNFNLSSSAFKTSTHASVANMEDNSIKGHASTGNIYIKSSLLADAWTNDDMSAVTSFLQTAQAQVCYELATTTTLATPKTDLKLLQDTNNLTTNGTTITLDYISNNSIGDAVKASEEYTDRAVERAIPKATFIDTWMISEESDTISVDLTSYDCNFFLLEYLFQSKRGTTLIPRPQGGSFSASVVTYNNGTPYYIELDYNPTTKELVYTSNVTSQFGILAIYTI